VTRIWVVDSGDARIETIIRASGLPVGILAEADVAGVSSGGPAPQGVLVVDVRRDGRLPPWLATLKRQRPATLVVLVASALEPQLMLEAMRAGITECVAEPLSESELQAAITRVSAFRTPTVAGKVYAFIGAKGGVGTTTAAVNVAVELSHAPASTLFVDLHAAYGDAAVFLGAEPRFSVIDALENTHRLDESFFKGLVVRTKAGPDLLASAERAVAPPVDVGRIHSLIQFASTQYRYTVLDVPRSEAAALEALGGVDQVVVVANQEVATVRSAGRIATALRQRYGKERVVVVVSRYDPHGAIGHDDVERVVGDRVRHMFPSDYRLALQALNTGRPLALENGTRLAASYRELAEALAGVKGLGTAHAKGSLFGGLLGRRSG